MDLNEVSVFIAVVQCGGFGLAGRKLAMPKSTVSHKISSLEKRLGVTLIQRTTRKLNITPAGSAYYKRCLAGVEQIHAAEAELAAATTAPHGLLRITAPTEIGLAVLPDLIARYTARFPGVSVELILSERRVDLLSENVDLAIRAGDLKNSTLIAKKLGEAFFAPVGSPKYLKKFGTPAHPRDLKDHRCLQFTPLGIEEWKLVGPKGQLHIPIPWRFLVNDLSVIKRMALLDEGIALLPTHVCLAEIESGKLVRVLDDWRSAISPIHFVYPAQRFVTPKLSAFIELATEPLKAAFATGKF